MSFVQRELARLIHDFRSDWWNISGVREGARRRCGFFLPLIGSDFDNALEDDGG